MPANRPTPPATLAAALCCILGYSAIALRLRAGGTAGDPVLKRGEEIARVVCAGCHVVASRQEFPPLLDRPTPSFLDIAQRPGIDAKTIQRFVSTTHWDEKTLPMKMPNLLLTPEQSVAVSRYILSLRKN